MIEHLDWNKMWMQALEDSTWRKRQGDKKEFEDEESAKHYDESERDSDRPGRIIAKLDIDSNCTALDIGPGPGILAIPLAKIVKQVTVVEPSEAMLSCLRRNAQREDLLNISCINKKWEEVVPFEGIKEHDVLIASHSLSMLDMREALSKMDQLAKRSVYLIAGAGDTRDEYEELWPRLHDEEYVRWPSYIYIYNILYHMGIRANVEMSEDEYRQSYSSLDEATEEWKNSFEVASQEGEEIVRSYLSNHLIEQDNELWFVHRMKSALIWWSKT